MTNFERSIQEVNEGTLKAPSVNYQGREINYFAYQLISHHFYLKLMAKGIGNRQIKLKDIKEYYGLKGKTASDVLIQFEALKDRILG